MAWFKCNLVDANILDEKFWDLRVMQLSGEGTIVSFETDQAFSLDPVIIFELTQTGSGTPSATNPRDYVSTESITLIHGVIDSGGSISGQSYIMNFNFKLFAGTLNPASGQLTTMLFGVDMGLLTYTQRSTGVLQVTKDSILSVTGYDMARYNTAAVYCPVATINSQTTNQIRFDSNVTAANAASTFAGHYLVYELKDGIFDTSFGTHAYNISANTQNSITINGSDHDKTSNYYVFSSVKKLMNI